MHLETFTKTKQKNYKNLFLMKYFYWIFIDLNKDGQKNYIIESRTFKDKHKTRVFVRMKLLCWFIIRMNVDVSGLRFEFYPDMNCVSVSKLFLHENCIRICTVFGHELYLDMNCIWTWTVSEHELYPDINCILIWSVSWYGLYTELYPDVNYIRMRIVSGYEW